MILLHRLNCVAGFFQRGDAERCGLRAAQRRHDGRAGIDGGGAKAAALGIAALKKSGYAVKTVQEYH